MFTITIKEQKIILRVNKLGSLPKSYFKNIFLTKSEFLANIIFLCFCQVIYNTEWPIKYIFVTINKCESI